MNIRKKFEQLIFFFLLGGILGGIISFAFIDYTEKVGNLTIKIIIIFLCCLVLCFNLQIILHELGHLLFGFFTGYKFVSFRIGSTIWVKDEKLRKGKYKLKGTGGQCIMLPPEPVNGKFPYILYNLGGVIVNLCTVILGILFMKQSSFNITITSSLFYVFSFILFLTGLFSTIINGVPYYSDSMVNDGYNVLALRKNKILKKSYYIMLKTNALQVKGKRIGELPYEWFLLPEDADLNNPINASIRILEGNWYYDNFQFEESKTCYETLINSSVKILDVVKQELFCELLYFELVSFQRNDIIESLYTNKLKRYIKATKFMASRQKLLYACAVVIEKDLKKAEEIYKSVWTNKDLYCIEGEVQTELKVLEWTKKQLIYKKST